MNWEPHFIVTIIAFAGTFIEIMGILTVMAAVRDTRSAQGAIAWSIALVALPVLALPLYWIFGRNKFHGYADAIHAGHEEYLRLDRQRHGLPLSGDVREGIAEPSRQVYESMADLPFLDGNSLELYVDGNTTFENIIKEIEKARKYVLVQFFIVRDDGIGRRLKKALTDKAAQGVDIYFLYDEVGCRTTPKEFWNEIRDAGIHVRPFLTTQGKGNRFQLNFRNHRKIVVVDGVAAFVGGHNVGDEYLGLSKKFGLWRDTHMKCRGPAAQGAQMSFAKDWYWAAKQVLDLDWNPPKTKGGAVVLALDTGPSDDLESCSIMFMQAINSAKERIWIASPYFVPDSAVIKALQLAALRGVDVRVMLPEKPDHLLVYLAAFASLKDLDVPGIRVYRYTRGFLHQKTFLVDHKLCAVGTANLDNRSFRLNFEITMLVQDQAFTRRVEQMFLADFSHCRETGTDEYKDKSALFKVAVKMARLFAPIL